MTLNVEEEESAQKEFLGTTTLSNWRGELMSPIVTVKKQKKVVP